MLKIDSLYVYLPTFAVASPPLLSFLWLTREKKPLLLFDATSDPAILLLYQPRPRRDLISHLEIGVDRLVAPVQKLHKLPLQDQRRLERGRVGGHVR